MGTLPLAVLSDALTLSRTGALAASAARIDMLREFVARFVDYHLEMQPRAHRRFLAGRLGLLVLFLLALAACSSVPSKLDPSKVEHALVVAEQDLAEGRTEQALDWMRSASAAENLPTAQRERVQVLLERSAQKRIEELSTQDSDPQLLADLVPLGLPRQMAVEAGMRAARRWHERGKEMKAFRELKQLDTRYPQHHEHLAAGDLMIAIGEVLSKQHKHFLFFYDTDDDAREVLEYTLLNHPSAARCDEGYATLSELYERDDSLTLAIDRLEKLVLYHTESPLRPAAQARIPHLRLVLLKSPEYDRGTLLKAERELKEWLRTFEDSQAELAGNVRIELGDCLRRLCENDLVIADFYKTVANAFGARYHAERAVSEAREAGDPERTKRAEEFLAKLPPADTGAARPREAAGALP